MKKLIAGNWKMNGTVASAGDLAEAVAAAVENDSALQAACDFVICPPSLHIGIVEAALDGSDTIAIGAQDCALAANGAFTGDLSAEMIKDSGCAYVILGHSERRQHHKETDQEVAAKAKLAYAAGLIAIICVGETEAQRTAGEQEQVVGRQLSEAIPEGAHARNTVIAYEPVWAIGTGKNATPEDVGAMHRFIRGKLKEQLADSGQMRILYGGSVKPDNAASLFKVDNVDGALIGGASLKADQYLAIAGAAKA